MSCATAIMTIVLLLSLSSNVAAQRKTENVILITLDGARTEELFGGMDLGVLKAVTKTKEGPVEKTAAYRKYWADTAQQRREKLMPFFWGTLMKHHGAIAGNRSLGSTVQLTNTHRFSYPGYSEILTGQAHDALINSNDKRRNPHKTVLEFLKAKLQLGAAQVAAFASWDTMGWIVEHERGAITSNAGYQSYEHPDPAVRKLNDLQFETITPWDSVRHDAYTFRFAMAHLRTYQPRVFYLSLGETDDWAHERRYDRTLEALERTDNYLRQLWEWLQSNSQYKGKTTIMITVDHGRGQTSADWHDHGEKVEGAQYTWLAILSPDVSLPRGELSQTQTIYQNQIAATLCRFLGLDYSEHNAAAGKHIAKWFERN
ncbi:MAG: hypothetical protein WKF30_10670 [Pyrinomonadaceae bacterium]